MIASLFLLVPRMEPPILGLALGVLIGGVLQLLMQLPPLRRKGFVYRSGLSLRHPGVAQAGRLIGPRILGSAVYQLSVIVDRVFASLGHIVGEGGVAALYYSNRIVQLPFALVAVSVATVALPTLSNQAHEKDLKPFRETLLFSLKSVFFVMMPALFGTLVLAEPIVRLLFERGSFDAYSTAITTQALFFYILGILSFSGSRILASAFYSLQDTRTPVKAACVALCVNILFNLLLMVPMKIGGIALATSISSTCHFFVLYRLLKQRVGPFGGGALFRAVFRYAIAGVLMASWLAWARSRWLQGESPFQIPALAGMIVAGGFSYFLFSVWLGVEEAHQCMRWIFRKK